METILKPTQVYYLEMRDAPVITTAISPEFTIKELSHPIAPQFYRELYFGVGKKWNWLDRMVISEEELAQKINAPQVHIFTLHWQGSLAGFAEFVVEMDHVEILYFGLLPDFTGKGLGPQLLQWAIQQAWSYQRPRIQLNTCSLDHPGALQVYKNAGFREVRTETQERRVLAN